MIIYILMFIFMFVLSVQDIRNREISAKLLMICAVISISGAVIGILSNNMSIIDVAISLLPGAGLLLLSFVTRQQIGYGDGLIALILGPALGIEILIIGLMAAFFGSGVFSLILLAVKKAKRKSRIPFVPFITLGTVVAYFATI
ncbi:MAG: prepilin peptidase [Butyrivibrio sp.]|nr:prepilin peptidase [Butyrivibrio sp.]